MKRPPTDVEILSEIYRRYTDEFSRHSNEAPTRATTLFVPIDIPAIAEHLGVHPEIIFGRLHYDLEQRYGYDRPGGTRVAFFTSVVGSDRNAVNFPYLTAVLASMLDDRGRHRWTLWLAIGSLVIATVSLAVALLTMG